MAAPYLFETNRLSVREFRLSDASFIIRLLNTPGWLKYIGDKKVDSIEKAEIYLSMGPLQSYENFGFGLWLVELKTGSVPIGMCGIIKREALDYPDIGFAFLPEYAGQGFALESAEASLQYAKDQYGFTDIAAITLPANTRSIRLLEKMGLSFNGKFCFPGSNEELLLYHQQFEHP